MPDVERAAVAVVAAELAVVVTAVGIHVALQRAFLPARDICRQRSIVYQKSSSGIPNRRRMARTMWTLTPAPGVWQLTG